MNRSFTTAFLLSKIAGLVVFTGLANAHALPPGELNVPSPDWREQIIYFVMLDRFNDGEPGNNDQGAGEYDPAKKSRYSGGDLSGLAGKIPYIKGLGATSVWITPPVAHQWWNLAVQYGGYHGYWGENLMTVDKHFGGLADLRGLSRRLHGEGMYLIQDIVVNHMGNYFSYDPSLWNARDPSRGYRREPAAARQDGAPSQPPFNLNDARDPKQAALGIYHWTPDIRDYNDPEQERNWQMAGLDDLNTENPRVREALRRSYGYWIREAGVDGFRVDTAFYVPPAYFRDFLYAEDERQPGIFRVAEASGRRNFLVFGEGFGIDKPYEEKQSAKIESYVRDPGGHALMSGMLNFPLYGAAIDIFARGRPTREMRHRIETMMRVHKNPHLMPSFVDNHDVDRFLANGSEAALKQALLLIMTLPGIPVIYYGTEQGFTEQRGAMFKTGYGSGGRDRFDENAPLYKSVRSMTALRRSNKVFTHGVPAVLKDDASGAGVFAYRMQYGKEAAFVLFNTADSAMLLDGLDTGLSAGSELRVAFTLDPFSEKLIVDGNGRLSAALPARSGIVLLPGAPVAGKNKPRGSLRIDALPAVVEGDTLAVSGRNDNAAAFQLVLDGELSRAVRITPAADGRWRALFPIGDLTDESVPHELTAWQAETAAVSQTRTFRAHKNWKTLLTVTDPFGDDFGRTGKLRYPEDKGWGENRQCDIEKISVSGAGGALRITVGLRGMTRLWDPPNGFDHTAVTMFLEMPGRGGGSRAMPGQNGELPDGMRWHYRLRVHGWANVWYGSEGAGVDNEGRVLGPGAQIEADPAAHTLRITLPAAALGYPAELSGTKLYLNTWDYDFGYRALSPEGGPMVFGGGKQEDTKVMDETAVIVLP